MLTSIVTGPINGLIFLARKIDDAVRQEREQEHDATVDALRKLHLQYEAGNIGEEAFEEQEEALLMRLENLESRSE
ncbi:hypothetical protein GCM10011363_44930 [Marivita lacus]|uniref:Gas vesicle protein GvpG n=1 Tax=Marivita lacus TaxID=1323742 RepID=A0ABQ1LFN0_9RHOB|nr:gas vesicle protein GvpG [Marivita lacus]GGC23474.1 hypothetical protein GCM10011363_44930 [Marivita lacus]